MPGTPCLDEVIIYGVGFQFAWGTIPWIYPAELFSMQEKETAVSLAVGVNYVPLTAMNSETFFFTSKVRE